MIHRRKLLGTGLALGAGVLLGRNRGAGAQSPPPSDTLHVALIGAGDQGRNLINAAAGIPGLRFRTVCDIWKYRRRSAKYLLETYKQEVNDYEDLNELLTQEKDLQAAIVATPDFLHAPHAIACLRAGLHVYCEKMMSNTLDAARTMVQAMRQTGKLLQIGYQRRSNLRYRHCCENLLKKAKLTGRLTQTAGRWNHPVREDLGWPKRHTMSDELLQKYGYAGMHEFRNWRFFKKYGAGPFGDFGAQMVDVARWFLGANPQAVMATGGRDYYRKHEQLDNVMAVLEFPSPEGLVRGAFQVLTTTSGGGGGNYEQFMGTDGTIQVSENPKWTSGFREAHAPDWEPWTKQGLLVKQAGTAGEEGKKPAAGAAPEPADPNEIHVRETGQVTAYEIPVVLDKPLHQPHLENFFEAVRGRAKLSCPADEALATEAVVHKVNEAVEARRLLTLGPDEFRVR